MADTLANKTYKDQYHFSKKYFDINNDDLPSIDVDSEVNSTIKKNPFRSNVEIEKDEIILEPDMSGLYKARGKKHSGGGIDVHLKADSFVFSDDKSLAFSEGDQDLFELKKGGKYKAKLNTPAKVLQRNVDPKHYNTLINNIEDPTKDDLAKKSSTMMLEKYITTLGNIAYAQEAKKGLPDGIPSFSMGTAPVFEPDLKNQIESQKQFAKYGGSIKNPYLPVLQLGGTESGNVNDRDSGIPRQDTPQIIPKVSSGPCPPGYRLDPWTRRCVPQERLDFTPPGMRDWEDRYTRDQTPMPEVIVSGKTKKADVKTEETKASIQPPKRIDWQFTPWQRMSHGYNAAKYAGARRYMPMRSHINPSYVDPRLLNPEQAIGDMRAAYNSQTRAIGAQSPILGNAQRADAYGKFLDAVPGVRSEYDAKNAMILNQSDAQNNQIRNNALSQNVNYDQDYDKASITGRANYDNMKSYLADEYMSGIMKDVATNQSMAYQMAAMNNPAFRFDFRTGQYLRNPKNILDVQGDAKSDLLEGLLSKIDFNKLSSTEQLKYLDIITKNKGLQYLKPAGTYKKGGRVNTFN